MSKQKVLELRRKILSGEELSPEELTSDEAYLADYECPFTEDSWLLSDKTCHKCKHKGYCEVRE